MADYRQVICGFDFAQTETIYQKRNADLDDSMKRELCCSNTSPRARSPGLPNSLCKSRPLDAVAVLKNKM